jgi:hypothetical protein
MRQRTTSVPTAAGGLRAVVWQQDDGDAAAGLLPGVVLVDGAMEGTADDTWAGLAAVVMRWPSTQAAIMVSACQAIPGARGPSGSCQDSSRC